MRLHELEEGKPYIGDDGGEYRIEADVLFKFVQENDFVSRWNEIKAVSMLTQNFTPNKEPVIQWYSVLAKRKCDTRPIQYNGCHKSEDDFLYATANKASYFDWIKLIPVCKTQGNKLVEEL